MKFTAKNLLTFGLSSLGAVTLVFALTAAGGNFPIKLNSFITQLKEKVQAYHDYKPEDRVYLHFDKPFYKPGDDIWFAAYFREGRHLKKSEKSDILHVELINPKGNVTQHIKLLDQKQSGFAFGDFHLDEEVVGGLWKVKAYTKWQDNESQPFTFEREFQVQKVVLPNLKMKLDFDRKAYGPGDEVTASLDLQTNANAPLAHHAFTYVASLDGEALVTQQGKTDATGKAQLTLDLPAELTTNDGLVNVMIAYEGLTESISRAVPIVLNQIDLSFYPEGGDLVAGLPSKVAFRARNEFGKPADIEGEIIDHQGATVAEFKSFHQGMGAFAFHPSENGETYHARITQPEGVKGTYPLPAPLPRGYLLNVDGSDDKELAVTVRSTENEALSLVAQVRGEIYWASEVNATRGRTRIGIPITDFPAGVCQLTLFDSKGIQRAERLAFVNRDKQMNISIETNQEKYLPREKVEMTVKVTDERGMPMPAHLSLSVVNDQLLSFADDKEGHIVSKLLLEPDLNEKVEEPKFYFDQEEEKSLAALDYLMLTSGWRRFKWEEVLTDRLPTLVHQGERALIVGFVKDAYNGQPIANATVTAAGSGTQVTTDKNGRYVLSGVNLAVDRSLSVTANNYYNATQGLVGYSQNQSFALYPNRNDILINGGVAPPQVGEIAVIGQVRRNEVENAAVALDNVQIKGRADLNRNRVRRNKKAKEMPRPGKAEMLPPPPAPVAEEVEEVPLDDDDFTDVDGEFVDEIVAIELEDTELEKAAEEPAVFLDGIEPKEDRRDKDLPGKPERGQMEQMGGKKRAAPATVATGKVQDMRFAAIAANDRAAQKAGPAVFYRAREFAAPVYTGKDAEAPHGGRTDFRETVYWNPNVEVDRSGTAVVTFYCSDEISSFRTTVEGIAVDGGVGHAEHVYFTQLPFSMAARVPSEVAIQDYLIVPVTLKNNTDAALSGSLHVIPPAGLEPVSTTGNIITIPAGTAKTLNLEYKVKEVAVEELFHIAFSSQGHTDAFKQPLKVVAAGFPVGLSFSGSESLNTHTFALREAISGSVSATLTAFPSVVSDLVKGIESILREPYGCFEQTSTSSYPNAMVMSYMQEQDDIDPELMRRSRALLDKGYKRLTSFECSEKGYEWFGSNPPHEALTAYGLMQFNDYQQVYEGVDKTMVDRTAAWLMSRRDGQGGFKRNGRALDTFGRADEDITNAYIVYALSEAGYTDIMKEADYAYEKALGSRDPYHLALVANAMFNLGQTEKGQTALQEMLALQADNGSFTGTKGSITRSGGTSLKVETTSLAVLALLKSGKPSPVALTAAVKSITQSRSGHGGFGSTQGTILGLKALVEYSKFSKKTDEAGRIEVYLDGEKVAEASYEAGHREPITIAGLEAFLTEGQHTIEVKYPGVKTPLPYALAIDYHTSLPTSSPECVVRLKTKLNATDIRMGETVRLSAQLINQTEEGQPMTMAILGLPAGLSAQPWQLKQHQEKGVFDFYEIIGNNVVCYYRQMKPGERRDIFLDLKADLPGTYTAPASTAYLYYTAEHKDWIGLPQIRISN
ncbi:MAG: MG2 domain-containing protein [Bacteroidota bacterium]